MRSRPRLLLGLLLAAVFGSAHCQLRQQPKLWQAALLDASTNARAQLSSAWAPQLAGSAAWPVVSATAPSGARFIVLAQRLKPVTANIQFAQAFCLSRGGTLAHWSTPAEAGTLAGLVLGLAEDTKATFHAFVGAVQLPGAAEPARGWTWLHDRSAVSAAAFPWAAGEPNQHRASKPGHTEDCAAVASYHGRAARPKLLDDFPCNFGTPEGKFRDGGWDPKLTVACRLLA